MSLEPTDDILRRACALVLRDDAYPGWGMVMPIPESPDSELGRPPVFVRVDSTNVAAINYWRKRVASLTRERAKLLEDDR